MRILTVRQPWAWAIIHGGKDVENRVKNIAGDYRGPVAIHVGLAYDRDALDDIEAGVLRMEGAFTAPANRGHIIGVVDLIDVHTDSDCYAASIDHANHLWRTDRKAFYALPTHGTAGGLITRAGLCSPWAQDDAWHLHLADPRALSEPIPYKGALGLRTLDDDTTARILAQIGA